MDDTPNLALPYIMAAQAQKHVTHNEAIRALDALVQLTVLDRDLSAPPESPADGARYIVAGSPSGAWAGEAGSIAAWQDGAWRFYEPREGWLAWVADESALLYFDGADWAAATSFGNPLLLGINATADLTNRLAVASDASLFSHDGADHRMKINKAAAGDTASQLFQTGLSGRAEFGLTGDDDWHVKVSPDGTTWHEALIADRATGRVTFPNTPGRETLAANRTYYVRTDGSDSNDGLTNSSGGAFLTIQHAVNVARALDLAIYTVTIQVGAGTFAENVSIGPLVGGANTATPLIILGAGYASTTIGAGSGNAIVATGAVGVAIGNFSLAASQAVAVQAQNGARIAINQGETAFPAATARFLDATSLGFISVTSNIRFTGNAPRAMYASFKGTIQFGTITVFVPAAVTFSTAFLDADRHGLWVRSGTVTFDLTGGSVTGKRYQVASNAVIDTAAGGASFFPGTVAGTTATGGEYI